MFIRNSRWNLENPSLRLKLNAKRILCTSVGNEALRAAVGHNGII